MWNRIKWLWKIQPVYKKEHQAAFVHIIWIKREAGATAPVELSDETGEVVMTDNPPNAASCFKTAQATFSQASAHLLSHSG